MAAGLLGASIAGSSSAQGLQTAWGQPSNSRVWDWLASLAPLPGTDPTSAAGAFDAMLQLGWIDESMLRGASPLRQAFSIARTEPTKLKNYIWGTKPAFERLLAAIDSGSPPDMAMLAGLGGLVGMSAEQLLEAERSYQAQIDRRLAAARPISEDVFASRLTLNERLAALARDIPDLDALRARAAEGLTTEINRVADIQSGDITRRAAAANFNPGRVLGEVERLRGQALQQVDLDALERASAILSLQAQQGSLLQGLLTPGMIAALQAAGTRMTGGQPGVPTLLAPPANRSTLSAGQAQLISALQSVGNLGGLTGGSMLGGGGAGAGTGSRAPASGGLSANVGSGMSGF